MRDTPTLFLFHRFFVSSAPNRIFPKLRKLLHMWNAVRLFTFCKLVFFSTIPFMMCLVTQILPFSFLILKRWALYGVRCTLTSDPVSSMVFYAHFWSPHWGLEMKRKTTDAFKLWLASSVCNTIFARKTETNEICFIITGLNTANPRNS